MPSSHSLDASNRKNFIYNVCGLPVDNEHRSWWYSAVCRDLRRSLSGKVESWFIWWGWKRCSRQNQSRTGQTKKQPGPFLMFKPLFWVAQKPLTIDTTWFIWFSTPLRKTTLRQEVTLSRNYRLKLPLSWKMLTHRHQSCLVSNNVTCNYWLK